MTLPKGSSSTPQITAAPAYPATGTYPRATPVRTARCTAWPAAPRRPAPSANPPRPSSPTEPACVRLGTTTMESPAASPAAQPAWNAPVPPPVQPVILKSIGF